MSTRILVLAVVLALVPSVAEAKPQRMTFDLAVLVARDYWAHRHIGVSCSPRPDRLTWAQTAGWGYKIRMLANREACEIDITPWTEPLRRDRDLAWIYCQSVVHEVGHLAGLGHDYEGVMAANPSTVPRGCVHPRRFLRRSPYAWSRSGF